MQFDKKYIPFIALVLLIHDEIKRNTNFIIYAKQLGLYKKKEIF